LAISFNLYFLQQLKPGNDSLFNINTAEEFRKMALKVFRYQSAVNPIYKRYIQSLKIKTDAVTALTQLPFLPIEFFKSQEVMTEGVKREKEDYKNQTKNAQLFISSGTTGSIQSKHYVTDVNIYEQSYIKGFQHFYGNINDYCILALLPSYLEREGSSLIYMVSDLIKKSKHPQSGFYLHNYSELLLTLKQLEAKKQKTILLGVSYALLDLAELIDKNKYEGFIFKNTIVMETGGMKGKRREMLREELHTILCKSMRIPFIHSEYGMTELLSQAYSKGAGVYSCPPWMKVMIRDVNDPFSFLPPQKTGGVNVIDLANINSCSFIATQDLGKRYSDDTFEILGRFDNSDARGCNLLVD